MVLCHVYMQPHQFIGSDNFKHVYRVVMIGQSHKHMLHAMWIESPCVLHIVTTAPSVYTYLPAFCFLHPFHCCMSVYVITIECVSIMDAPVI